MFQDACHFNGNIAGWNVGNAIFFNNMFAYAQSFNAAIGGWKLNGAPGRDLNMQFMFAWHGLQTPSCNVTSYAFNQDLSPWSSVTSKWTKACDGFNQGLIMDANGALSEPQTNPAWTQQPDLSSCTPLAYCTKPIPNPTLGWVAQCQDFHPSLGIFG